MINSKTDALLRLTTPEVQDIFFEWFSILSERYSSLDNQKVNGRAWRAELKRAEAPYGVMLCEGYNALTRRVAEKMTLSEVDKMALSLFVSVAVHIKRDNADRSFAAQLGEKRNGSTSCVSSLRFERMLKARQPDDFCRLLIQAVRIRDKEGCNIIWLADSLFIWMKEWADREANLPESSNPFERSNVRWVNEYLSTSR
ncbi:MULTISPECIES: type I-E CRISPR-associated protein Cse2/CasB [Enterobacterales]|uniref:type I-E CRISPR-associated protein Cse2/CasB n=1 Tax=Enterobacterales TaxID=91347 RepID=UPI002EDB4F75